MTYADQCLERAEKATEAPWAFNGLCAFHIPNKNTPIFVLDYATPFKKIDAEFIAHARTDVPELARRLKVACGLLEIAFHEMHNLELKQLFFEQVKELEASLEEK